MQSVSSPALAPAIGPYSPAMKLNGFLVTSGQMPVTADGRLVEGGIEEQTRQIFNNVRALLSVEGMDVTNVLKTTVYVQDLRDYPKLNAVYAEEFLGHKPARTTIQVAALPMGAKVEIEFIAAVR